MDLAAVRADVAVINDLLQEFPQWPGNRDRAAQPEEEAWVAAEAAAAEGVLLDAYESGDAPTREQVRDIFRTRRTFSARTYLPREWSSAADLRRRLIRVSAIDQSFDARDDLMMIWSLCNRARELGIDVLPVLREVAALSCDVDRYGMGSMQVLIMRGVEEHDLSR